jgi:hypothetical protein
VLGGVTKSKDWVARTDQGERRLPSDNAFHLTRWAKYPLATRRWSRIPSLPEHEVRAIYDKDWLQYSEWLTRGSWNE